jgi:hypothetical protein
MPRKQPLGRKRKAGTGNNSTVPATRIISKTKVTTTAEINTKNVVQQVVRDLEKQDLERDEFHEGLFSPVSCFAGGMGICDAVKFLWRQEPTIPRARLRVAPKTERPQYRAGVFKINDEFVRADSISQAQRAAQHFGARGVYMDPRYGPMLKQPGVGRVTGARVVRPSMCAETSCG